MVGMVHFWVDGESDIQFIRVTGKEEELKEGGVVEYNIDRYGSYDDTMVLE
jgi:hypothetical protein